jgi:ferredoxin--NADP+ reductase
VRGGVAPDHQHTKSVIKSFAQAAQLPGFKFFGNVTLGRDIHVADLLDHYHQIVYACGNERERSLGVPREALHGVTPASEFVGWYNAHPDHRDLDYDAGSKRVAVVGNGNVAVDVVRILAKTAEDLATTDIAEHALVALAKSGVTDIYMLGRRGPAQAAFTPAELEELAELPDVGFLVDGHELELDAASRAAVDAAGAKAPVRHNLEILQRGVGAARKRRNLHFRFCVSPVEFLGDTNGRVRAVRLEHNELATDGGAIRARGTGRFTELPVDWVCVSIGYRGERISGVPFDEKRGIIPNRDGRVIDNGAVVPHQYVVGWAKTGPQGLIGPHKKASAAVVETMLADAGSAMGKPLNPRPIEDLLHERGVRFVTFADWQRIDAAEIARGRPRGAPRSKFASVRELLDAIPRPA